MATNHSEALGELDRLEQLEADLRASLVELQRQLDEVQILRESLMSRRLRRQLDLASTEGAPAPECGTPDLTLDELPMYPWQSEALNAWQGAGSVGVIEAVTGAGKTRVGLAAIAVARAEGRRVVVIVPTRVLVDQWTRLVTDAFPQSRVTSDRTRRSWDILVSTVQAVARVDDGLILRQGERPLLVADECHRYGADSFARSLLDQYEQRLGLSATFERGDEGDEALRRYFTGVVYELTYDRALKDGVIAPYALALAGVQLTARERHEYDTADERLTWAKRQLIARHGVDDQPMPMFLRSAQRLAEQRDVAGRSARAFLSAFAERRRILAETTQKHHLLVGLSDIIAEGTGALVFTQTQRSADIAAAVLREAGCQASSIHSATSQQDREEHLVALGSGTLPVIAAPRILDEGVDLPDVDLGILVARSRNRRQATQRLGRVLRRKDDGRHARLIVLFAEGTVEDPRIEAGATSEFDAMLPHAQHVLHTSIARDSIEPLRAFLGAAAGGAPAVPAALALLESGTPEPPATPPSVKDLADEPLAELEGLPEPSDVGAFLLSWGDDADGPPAVLPASGATADPVKDYVRSTGKFQLLNAAQEVELAIRIEVGLAARERLNRRMSEAPEERRLLWRLEREGQEAHGQFTTANLRLVTSIAKQYTGLGMPFLDLIQEGNLGLMRAVQKFDFRQGIKFSTYATWWIRQAMTRALADEGRTIRIPVHAYEGARAIDRARCSACLSWSEAARQPHLLGGRVDE